MRSKDEQIIIELGDEVDNCLAQIREQSQRIASLEAEKKKLQLRGDGFDAQLHMTVQRLGGSVEGQPTARLNFLQRVDELVRIEAAVKAYFFEHLPTTEREYALFHAVTHAKD